MTQKQIQKLRSRLASLYNSISGVSIENIILEIVELELLLEAENNR
jgi:hypothetical protein